MQPEFSHSHGGKRDPVSFGPIAGPFRDAPRLLFDKYRILTFKETAKHVPDTSAYDPRPSLAKGLTHNISNASCVLRLSSD